VSAALFFHDPVGSINRRNVNGALHGTLSPVVDHPEIMLGVLVAILHLDPVAV
jgi:hypothetical protein